MIRHLTQEKNWNRTKVVTFWLLIQNVPVKTCKIPNFLQGYQYATCKISRQSIPFYSSYPSEIWKKLVSLPLWSLNLTWLKFKPHKSILPFVVWHLVVKCIWKSFIFTQVIIQTQGKCLFEALFGPLIIQESSLKS